MQSRQLHRASGGAKRAAFHEDGRMTKEGLASGSSLPLKQIVFPGKLDAALWLAGPGLAGPGLADPAGPDDVLAQSWTLLSTAEQNRANRLSSMKERQLFAMTRASLRLLLSEKTGLPALAIRFVEGPHGKPRLAGTARPHFNVSHSGDFALIGLSDSRPIGVDIEFMRRSGDEMDVARSLFSELECRRLAGLAPAPRRIAFYRIWTCKEAVLKALGVGISQHLKAFSVDFDGERMIVQPEPACQLPALFSIAAGLAPVPDGYAGCYALA